MCGLCVLQNRHLKLSSGQFTQSSRPESVSRYGGRLFHINPMGSCCFISHCRHHHKYSKGLNDGLLISLAITFPTVLLKIYTLANSIVW